MAKPVPQKYDDLSTSQLAQLTRERGLVKPSVTDAGGWAAWLREQDKLGNQPAPHMVIHTAAVEPAVEPEADTQEFEPLAVEPTETEESEDEAVKTFEQLADMKKAELIAYAAWRNVDLTGANTRDAIIEAIQAKLGVG